MEILLNLAWMLLALPAYWLWRGGMASRARRGAGSLQVLLALACVLVLLFPVISASDDLHAMRAEMEDSSISKRAVRQANSGRHASWVNRLQGSAGLMALAPRLSAPQIEWLQVAVTGILPLRRPTIFYAGRAPPVSFLG
jgi:hypothetical protein